MTTTILDENNYKANTNKNQKEWGGDGQDGRDGADGGDKEVITLKETVVQGGDNGSMASKTATGCDDGDKNVFLHEIA